MFRKMCILLLSTLSEVNTQVVKPEYVRQLGNPACGGQAIKPLYRGQSRGGH